MHVCCRCNGSGRCKAYLCVKSGTLCVDCLPSCNGHCSNLAGPSLVGPECHSDTVAASSNSNANVDNSPEIVAPEFVATTHDATSTQSASILTSQTSIENQSSIYFLPSFEPLSDSDYQWNDLTGPEFSNVINDAYNQIVHWFFECHLALMERSLSVNLPSSFRPLLTQQFLKLSP